MRRILLALALLVLAACNLTGNIDPIDETEDIAPDMDAALTGWSKARFIAGGEAQKVTLSPKGEVFVAGYYTTKGKIYLRKYSSTGSYQWMKTLPRTKIPGQPTIESLQVGPNNKIYMLVSYFYSPGPKSSIVNSQVYVVSSSGTLDKQFAVEPTSKTLIVDKSNNLYVLTQKREGDSRPFTFSDVLSKYTSGGAQLWSKTIGTGFNVFEILLDPKGNIRALGQFSISNVSYSLVSFDPQGNQVEAKNLADFDGSNLALMLSDGRMVVVSGSNVLVYDAALNLISKKPYQIPAAVLPSAFVPLSIVVQGDTLTMVGNFQHTFRGYMVQFGLDGSFKKGYEVQNSANDVVFSDNSLLVVGASTTRLSTQPKGNSEGYVVRYNSDLQPPPNPIPLPRYLDASFENGVKQKLDFGFAMALQRDGKILVGGTTTANDIYNFALARFNASGSPDTTFGKDGKVTTDIDKHRDQANAIALQSDGKILLAGYSSSTPNSFALVRYNTDGSLDTTFDGDGKVTTVIGPFNSGANAVAVQGDGKIVLAGFSWSTSGYPDFALVRYNPDGSLDASFGSGGKVTTGFDNPRLFIVNAMAIDSDGKIVLAADGDTGFTLARYNRDGSLDASFGTGGMVFTATPGFYAVQPRSVAVQSDGKIVLGGYAANASGNYDYEFALARYNPNGSPDMSFDGDGLVITAISPAYDQAFSMALQSDGKIVLAGYTRTTFVNYDFALVRYTPSGSLDASFGEGGKMITDLDGGEQILSIALQADGKIVAFGQTSIGNTLVRFSP